MNDTKGNSISIQSLVDSSQTLYDTMNIQKR